MSTKTRTGAMALALTVALAVAGCGSDGDHAAHGTPRATTTAAAATASPTAVDEAFVAQMVPHHEMAIEMAGLAPARGRHAERRELGRSILRTQAREVTELRRVAATLGVTPGTMSTDHDAMDQGAHGPSMAADAEALGLSMDDMGMSMTTDSLRTARPFDRAFIDMMIPHHQGAIRMARAELEHGRNAELRTIARKVIAAQTREIVRMTTWRTRWYGAASPAGGVPAS
jgi:uncharacterized protein (DUF305 family)